MNSHRISAQFLQFLPDIRVAAGDFDVVRPQSVHQFVRENLREKGVKGDLRLL